MDNKSKKILKYINKNNNKNFSLLRLIQIFPNISKDHLIEIVHCLYKNDYIKYVGDKGYIKPTNKGKTYFSVARNNWLSKNIIAILALFVSILAFIEATISLLA